MQTIHTPHNWISADALAAARQEAAGLPVAFHEAGMRDLPWAAAFDGAYCLGNSFGYLDHAGIQAFVAALARALEPGARLVVDTGMVAEIRRLVEGAGFVTRGLHGSTDAIPYTLGTPRLIAVFERRT